MSLFPPTYDYQELSDISDLDCTVDDLLAKEFEPRLKSPSHLQNCCSKSSYPGDNVATDTSKYYPEQLNNTTGSSVSSERGDYDPFTLAPAPLSIKKKRYSKDITNNSLAAFGPLKTSYTEVADEGYYADIDSYYSTDNIPSTSIIATGKEQESTRSQSPVSSISISPPLSSRYSREQRGAWLRKHRLADTPRTSVQRSSPKQQFLGLKLETHKHDEYFWTPFDDNFATEYEEQRNDTPVQVIPGYTRHSLPQNRQSPSAAEQAKEYIGKYCKKEEKICENAGQKDPVGKAIRPEWRKQFAEFPNNFFIVRNMDEERHKHFELAWRRLNGEIPDGLQFDEYSCKTFLAKHPKHIPGNTAFLHNDIKWDEYGEYREPPEASLLRQRRARRIEESYEERERLQELERREREAERREEQKQEEARARLERELEDGEQRIKTANLRWQMHRIATARGPIERNASDAWSSRGSLFRRLTGMSRRR